MSDELVQTVPCPTCFGRQIVSDEKYDELVREHHALIAEMGVSDDAVDGRCMQHPRDCRCYWPLRQSDVRPFGHVPVERLRAAIRLLGPGEMTPTAKRMLESICDEHA
jgi:hypothetical protein